MRLPRMTTRRWMVAAAVVAVVVALTIEAYRAKQRRDAYLARDAYFARREAAYRRALARAPTPAIGQTWEVIDQPLVDYHAGLARKYTGATFCRWLPVEPDPPEPE